MVTGEGLVRAVARCWPGPAAGLGEMWVLFPGEGPFWWAEAALPVRVPLHGGREGSRLPVPCGCGAAGAAGGGGEAVQV